MIFLYFLNRFLCLILYIFSVAFPVIFFFFSQKPFFLINFDFHVIMLIWGIMFLHGTFLVNSSIHDSLLSSLHGILNQPPVLVSDKQTWGLNCLLLHLCSL